MGNIKIKKDDKVLLIGEKNYLLRAGEIFNSQYGKIDLKKIVGQSFGCKVKVSGKEFTVVQPTLIDVLYKFKEGRRLSRQKTAHLSWLSPDARQNGRL